MSLLKTGQCFTNELGLPANKNVIAATFLDCNGDALVPNTQLATCADIPAFATPAETRAGTSTTTIVNPADLYARESIAAQTGVSNDVTAIPAPAAGQSPWATNLLGETLHYAPGLGWKIVDDRYGYAQADVLPEGDTVYTATMPRAGIIDVSGYMKTIGVSGGLDADTIVSINPGNTDESIVAADRTVVDLSGTTADANHFNSAAANRVPVAAGQVVTFFFRNTSPGAASAQYRFSYQYTK